MAQIDYIPFDVLHMIIVRLISPSVESLDDWTECISVLAVSRLWRMIGQPLLYSNIVIDLDALSTALQTIHSNTSLVVSNSFEDHVRATVIHISPDLDRADAIAAFLFYMPTSLTTNLNMPNTMRGFWRMSDNPTTLLGGACIEPLLLSMPNLRYLFVESRFINEPWMEFMSMFLNYSVSRQVNSRIGVSWFTEFDFITSFNNEGIAPLDSNAAMTRMVLAPSSREQSPLSRSRRRFVLSDDRVIFCAEYIRRLRILDIPQSALGLDASIDALRDRNPCLPRENDTLNLWYNTRYRSYLYVPNIWFENSTNGVTRYELFAFNRNANDHMLQIATSMPPEDSEPVQYPDFISDYASSGSDPDDGYFSH